MMRMETLSRGLLTTTDRGINLHCTTVVQTGTPQVTLYESHTVEESFRAYGSSEGTLGRVDPTTSHQRVCVVLKGPYYMRHSRVGI